MRYLQIVSVILLIFSLLFAGWANSRYYSSLNTDDPVLTSQEETLKISVNDPEDAIFRGLKATDATDGDLTDKILVASMSHFVGPGAVNVKYVVFDSHNNSATLTRRVEYTDYTPPVFSLQEAPVYTVGEVFDILENIRATDSIDGDISDRVRVISNTVSNFNPGTYPVVLEVSNSCGDTAQVTLWVNYLSKSPTAKVNLREQIVYLEAGGAFEPRQWLTSVTATHAVALDSSLVEVQGNLDTTTPGAYPMVYRYDDGKLSGLNTLTVVVTERQGQ